uniref:peptide chain release factor N(5)-glutamine methyltransferase n=1 Tax=candidate division WOR-3 bacterium TaxID=2052148 RepID=A0A7C4CBH5_UNCW3
MIASASLLREATQAIPLAEAEFLLATLLRVPRHLLYLDTGPVPAHHTARFRTLVRQAAAGVPVQYLVRSAPFLNFELYVDRRVLIPRPETEELVLRAAARVRLPRLVVDYGTGSGCIAIALARLFPRSRIIAVDSSSAALRVCRRNANSHGFGSRLKLVRAESLSAPPLRRLAGRVDLLISNPPYVPAERIQRLSPSVRDFEPLSGLDGGRKGTKILAMLLKLGPSLLSRQGLLAIEVDSTHAGFVTRHAPCAEIERDLSGRTRYAFLSLCT